MYFIFYLFVFCFGLIIGSFLNVVIYRLEKDEDFVKGRSYCPHCKHQLTWPDLIPVVSFLFLQGKCRYCHTKISWQYPLVEIATGLIFLLIFNQLSTYQLINLFFLFYIASVLIVIFVYDLKFYLIPDKVLFPAIIIAFLYRLVFVIASGVFLNAPCGNLDCFASLAMTGAVLNYVLAAILASGFFLFLYLISRGQWMGFGDVKLAILLGLLLGFPSILVGLFLSFFFGAIIGVVLLFFKKKGLKSEMPFAPFLIIGTLAAMFWGDKIINWYMRFLIF